MKITKTIFVFFSSHISSKKCIDQPRGTDHNKLTRECKAAININVRIYEHHYSLVIKSFYIPKVTYNLRCTAVRAL